MGHSKEDEKELPGRPSSEGAHLLSLSSDFQSSVGRLPDPDGAAAHEICLVIFLPLAIFWALPYLEWCPTQSGTWALSPGVSLRRCPTQSGPWAVPYPEWALGGALPRVGLGRCPTQSGPWALPYLEWVLGVALPRVSLGPYD
ncbi:hypothetical protein U1Q18_038521 [Sarracenia purpurea var. burkii]